MHVYTSIGVERYGAGGRGIWEERRSGQGPPRGLGVHQEETSNPVVCRTADIFVTDQEERGSVAGAKLRIMRRPNVRGKWRSPPGGGDRHGGRA